MLFLRGFILGFSIAAPVGPIAVLCIRRAARDGWLAGLVSGLGAATADMLYGSVAAFGLKAISDFLINGQTWLRSLGGLFLIYLGLRTLVLNSEFEVKPAGGDSRLANYASTFMLTLTNPMTILSFAAVFATIIPADAELTTLSSLQMVLGVFLGSVAWWTILSVLIGALKGRLSSRLNRWIQWISGCVIILFGLAALSTLLRT
jgi:threonine/homoserine/homoserine lactone efflux protein